jgi:hypothetical protein
MIAGDFTDEREIEERRKETRNKGENIFMLHNLNVFTF